MDQASEFSLSNEEFQLFRTLVYEKSGVALKEEKLQLLRGRLMKRLRHHGYATFIQYYEHLKQSDPSGAELQEMINAVTTHKTSFFREPHHFNCLVEKVLEPARQRAAEGRRPSLRLWSAGCSTGEEAYSIAITIVMNLERLATWDVKILATDIDTAVVEKGRAGIYPRESVSEIPDNVLKECFLSGRGKQADAVGLKPAVKNLVTFARLNLMEEPWPFRGHFDAIFCRNVLIYFDRNSQRHVVERFAKQLKPEGLFFAGHSENLFWLGNILQPIGQTVYQLAPAEADDATSAAQPQ